MRILLAGVNTITNSLFKGVNYANILTYSSFMVSYEW